jgi:hypothetical protein
MLWLAVAGTASAAGTCSVTSVAFTNQTYTGAALTATGTVNWQCTRQSNALDGNRNRFTVTAGPGLNYAPSSRRVGNAGTFMSYGLTSGAAWGNGVTAGLGNGRLITANFPNNASLSVTGSFTFNFTLAAGLNPLTGRIFTDTIAVGGTCTTRNGTACTVTGSSVTFNVAVPVTCSVSTPPTVPLAYTAFQSSPAQGNSPFIVNCSNGGPYRMSVSPTGSTVLGITYTLKLGTAANSATDISSTTTYNLTGTGTNITRYVNATAAPGQAGTCAAASCTQNSANHTLIVDF